MSWTGNDRDHRSHFEEPYFSVRGVRGACHGKARLAAEKLWEDGLVMDWSVGKGSGSFFSLWQAWSQSVICRVLLSSQEPTPTPPNQLPLQEKQGGISNTYNQICMAAREGGGCWEERFKKGRALAVVSPKFSLANSQGNLFSSCVESLLCTRHFQ